MSERPSSKALSRPRRLSRQLADAHQILTRLRDNPQPLSEDDRERLQDMRDAIDIVLADPVLVGVSAG